MIMKKYNYNENYFEKIDSPEKAYCLGFWYADGNVTIKPYGISISQAESQVDILEKISKEISGNKPLYECKIKKGQRVFY